MKRQYVIDQVDRLLTNHFDRDLKENWLDEAESLVKHSVLENYEENSTAGEGEVLAPDDFCMIYVHWLEAKIAYYSGDYDRYANAYRLFNSEMNRFAEHYHRTHTPKSSGTWKY